MASRCAFVAGLFAFVAVAGAATSQPATTAPADVDAALWSRMLEINQRGSQIKNLTADFEQQKFTALLKKPLTSDGRIIVVGSSMRWDTDKPQRTSMLVNQKEVQLFYPDEQTVEVYPIDARLGALASSPLPQLDVLKRYFSFKQIPVTDLEKDAAEESHLALRMTPIEASLREHVQEVRVLLDAKQGVVVRAEMTDSDGDRTTISFTDVHANQDRSDKDVELKLPAGVKVVHPLEALQGQTK